MVETSGFEPPTS